MEIAKTYSPKEVEDKWYAHWMEQKFFRSVPDKREPYTIVIPPPNVTGQLHMGHMLNNTIQDVLIRKARLQGYNACWVPGTDHASIATEAKVVNMLREQGIKKSDLTREEFLEHAFEWKDKYGGIILEQLKRLGASCDWDRTRFTMEDSLYKAVIKVFVDQYNKGNLYRDLKMVNWDPKALTVLSNEEVIYKENKHAKLYHVKYRIDGTEDYVTIATTRPETILGDTAVCINPKDERYQHLKGKMVVVPLVNRRVPIIFDDYVDMEFGTGVLKITPAHDVNDYEIGQRHELDTIDIFNDDATISYAAGMFVGEDRFTARKLAIAKLEEDGLLVKVDEIVNKVGYSERNPDTVVEPKLSLQWFVDMSELVKPALKNVMNDQIRFFPESFKNLYRHWMENIRNWPISRQLWWGQRIPAWYLKDGSFVVAENEEEALKLAQKKFKKPELTMDDLRQDEDVLDTWFSSWLWPISVFDGFENRKELDYYYPTQVLVTGWDIIFFWVARMIIAGYEYEKKKPFEHVYFTGMVRDIQGRKMSKQLGNSPDPLELINKFGADGVRVGMLIAAPSGNDLLFDEKLCEQGRNFSNKLWNAVRLIKGWEVKEGKNEENEIAIKWLRNKLNKTVADLDKSYKEYRISEALMTTYSFIWDDFCAWYLEMIKPDYQQPIDQYTYEQTILLLEDILRILHPFMPFITEEIWHLIGERGEKDSLMVNHWPQGGKFDEEILKQFDHVQSLITEIRNLRNQFQLKPKDPLDVFAMTKNKAPFETFGSTLTKLAVLGSFNFTDAEVAESKGFLVGTDQFYVTGIETDAAAEKEEMEKELQYTRGFVKSVEGKLKNERFVNNAPEDVVAKERQKLEDGLSRIKSLEESLAKLN